MRGTIRILQTTPFSAYDLWHCQDWWLLDNTRLSETRMVWCEHYAR